MPNGGSGSRRRRKKGTRAMLRYRCLPFPDYSSNIYLCFISTIISNRTTSEEHFSAPIRDGTKASDDASFAAAKQKLLILVKNFSQPTRLFCVATRSYFTERSVSCHGNVSRHNSLVTNILHKFYSLCCCVQ